MSKEFDKARIEILNNIYGVSDYSIRNWNCYIDIEKYPSDEIKIKKSLLLIKQQSEEIRDEANKIIELCERYEYVKITGDEQ
jgi:hypothetical protein